METEEDSPAQSVFHILWRNNNKRSLSSALHPPGCSQSLWPFCHQVTHSALACPVVAGPTHGTGHIYSQGSQHADGRERMRPRILDPMQTLCRFERLSLLWMRLWTQLIPNVSCQRIKKRKLVNATE